ncbi:MAG: 2-oxoglutarate ferredoxin oxidoreductase subunit gamma [Bacteroidetes bacterium GWF2_42_66]|nr:MAG: 2-oxoglutarate ferredoxin oxidoreductase subunit gamma [Bacteroidetes bacterium GWA2_42_15]OFY01510.1 MAG: 2-oxoglutarate ferredoxin oxidoreductase subunit gamma [Bacteroidetes bacterium GWE2_42_39]OFY43309.1 MAG: 2-oxoglutarate ferredoxin oxidoreductase subunit gamma [Bacteroidetes bacterium GWF2_42_66]HBL77508.1 2-oxoglutarate ferredoxin oxidoreductase subunit gamma [Prolixibacteraceae bacterium]HCU61709.1 2-oxoglutarate ferredoxin oxidoreductase subunit gamma [Prolixibacteraceae bact
MTEELIIAGFGGQGVLSMGKILAYSGVMAGQEVTWFPSYGPEMRGGTANVTVILSDKRISSPIINEFDTAIILNQQSMDKFEKMVKPGGTLLYDPNGITRNPERTDINLFKIDGTKIAADLGNVKIFNMVVLGAYLKAKPVVNIDSVEKGLQQSLPARHHKLIPLNLAAVQKGYELLESVTTL